jgi:hypothetical protein
MTPAPAFQQIQIFQSERHPKQIEYFLQSFCGLCRVLGWVLALPVMTSNFGNLSPNHAICDSRIDEGVF